MGRKTRRVVISVIVIFVIALALIIVRSYIFSRVNSTIQQKLRSLTNSGCHVTYDSINVDWKMGVIEIEALVIQKNAYDTTCVQPEYISVKRVVANGFSLGALILKRELEIKSLQLFSPHFVFRQHSTFLRDSAARRDSEFMLSVRETKLIDAKIEYLDSTTCALSAAISSNITISSLMLRLTPDKPVDVTMEIIALDRTRVDLPPKLYRLEIKKININLTKGIAILDTIKIEPHHQKLAFGRKKGYEVDRIEGVIPFIRLAGLSVNYKDTVAISATRANIQVYLKIFRDKRLPFKKIYKPLPLEQLRNLAFGLNIDTLKLVKSYVEYEEFADDAQSPGMVFFDNLEAVIYNVNNDAHLRDGKTVMQATAALMGQGDLRVTSEFPWNDGEKCLIEGELNNMKIAKVNSMMRPVTNMKVESGNLESLTFRFAYDNKQSAGELELNYNDLKLISYKDEEKLKKQEGRNRKNNRKHKPRKQDNLKTLILNAFVIRKNMDEKVPEGKRSGAILFYRDTQRSVFNYWWKSLLSGLRAAFNLDRYNERDNKKNVKKARGK